MTPVSCWPARRPARKPSPGSCAGPASSPPSERFRAKCCSACSSAVAAGLIRDVGFEPVDAGPLRMARYMEPFTLLIAQLAYEGTRGPELAYRFERLGKRR